MDREAYTDGRRCSFNYSIANPAAESTKLHHSGNSFRWGSSPISRRQRCNSSINLISLDSSAESSVPIETSRCNNVRKIDPRIVADVQSKGLASRIVKYHENGNRLNRSMSAHNLYCKPGQFPVVTLKKTDLPSYRATKQNVSMTRIIPPDKSVFYGNTLSSLLRSNSVMCLQKSDEDISRENRPILHPPPTENDMAPTRSVLDVLKEISRKRINSDDPNRVDSSKKNRIGCDILDAGTNATVSNISPANMTMMTHSYKRQRDVNSPYKVEISSHSKFQDTNKSPEQAKKRVCSYNNDITSSLSSSAKRKPYENKRPSYQLNQTTPTYLESYEAQKVKMQKCNDSNISADIRLNHITSTLKFTDTNNAITPLAVTPSINQQQAYGVVPQRSKSEPLHKLEEARPTSASTQPTNKPRLTLFNKNYDVNNETYHNDIENGDNFDQSSECAGIHFVKPKKITSTGLKNPIIERTQKTKLALMLSGLRGELYQCSDDDDLNSPKEQENNNQENNHLKQITVREGAASISSSNTSTCNSGGTLHASSNTSKLPESTALTQPKINPISKNTSPLVGLKLTPQSSFASSNLSQEVDVSQQLSTPVLGGFSCNNISSPKTSVAVNTTSCNTSNASSVTKTVVTKSVPFGTFNQSSTDKPPTTPNEIPTFKFGPTVEKITPVTGNTSAITASTAAGTHSFTFVPSNIANIRTDNKHSISPVTASAGIPAVTMPANDASPAVATEATPENNAANTDSSRIGSTDTSSSNAAFSNPFNCGSNSKTNTVLQNGITEVKPTGTSSAAVSFSFGTPSNSQSIASGSKAKTSQDISAVPTTTAAPNTQFIFGSSMAPNKASSPLASAFTFGCSSNKDNIPNFNTNNSNVIPSISSATRLGVTSFNPTSTNTGPVLAFSAPTTTSNMFGSPNVVAAPVISTSTTKNATTTFGSAVFGSPSAANTSMRFGTSSADNVNSANNTSIPSLGFAFGTETNKSLANGSFAFGDTGKSGMSASASSAPTCATQSKMFAFASNAKASDKNNSTNIFGGSTTNPPEATPSSAGFSFGSSTSTGIQKQTTFTFGSTNSLSTTGNTSASPASGFSFAATAPPKPIDSTSNKQFSFGPSSATAPQSSGASNSNQTPSNMFAAPLATKGSTPTFNFGANQTTNTQSTSIANATNNLFAPSASSDRPIRRATRRLQK